MITFIFGLLLGIFICVLIPPTELLRKIAFAWFKASEYISQKGAEMADNKDET